jgi:hypothetical protein
MYSIAGKFEGFNFIADDNFYHFTGLMNFSDHAHYALHNYLFQFNSLTLDNP